MFRFALPFLVGVLLANPAPAGTLAYIVTTGSDTCPALATPIPPNVSVYCAQVADSDLARIITDYGAQPQYGQIQATDPDGSKQFDENGDAIMRPATAGEIQYAIIMQSLHDMLARALEFERNSAAQSAASQILPIPATPK
jgi:hypothetical protein